MGICYAHTKPHAVEAARVASRLLMLNRVGTVRAFSKPKPSFIYNASSWPGSSVGRAED
jgi:hypothetical protein